MRKLLTACAVLCICIAPAFAGPKEPAKDAHKDKAHECATCQKMEKAGEGWCDHCKMGMVSHIEVKDAKVYKAMKDSSYAKALDKGTEVKASEIKCAECKKNFEGHKDGFCKKCDGGLVAGHFFKGKEAYEKAEHAEKVLREAARAKCEGCAVAMASDGKCEHCKVSYKDGKKVKA